ncbi:hypothetical protein G9A89_020317 [Geosiphon pyriformis]|nr:hypothetical protein G9A89_020317 [Geosiphon pyriformis]
MAIAFEHQVTDLYPITYASEGKKKLQTPAITPRKIQPPAWKKNRVETPSNPFYHYTPGSAINILSTDAFPSIVISAFGRFPFQSRQRKTELLEPYGEYFERFNLQSSTSSGLRSLLPPPDFRISDPWEVAESEKKEEESEDQEFTYQNSITENLKGETPNLQAQQKLNIENSEIGTLNQQRQNNPNLAEPIQQPLQLPPQHPPPQLSNLDPMAYAPIAKLDNFTGEENDAQVWLNNNTTNSWYQSLVNKPQDFNAFKAEFLRYFSNNNSINCLVNTFTTMKQRETETVITYLGHFHQNLCQIQVIDNDYFTAPQILNQFICGLHSSILQHVHPLHPGTLQDAVTHARDFESAELEANHAQAINLVMNRLSELDSKLEKFSESINKRLEGYLADNHTIYQPSQRRNNQGNSNPTNLSTASISTSNLSAAATSNISTAATNHLSTPTNSNTTPEPSTNDIRQLLIQSYSKLKIGDGCLPTNSLFAKLTIKIMHPEFGYHLLVTPEDTTSNYTESNQHVPTNMIPPATISSNEFLAAIFSFKLKENTPILLFSGATLEEKPITAMYTDAKVDGHSIKLILDSGSAGSIITRQLMNQLGRQVDQAASARIIIADGTTKTPISEIDDFPIEINGIIVPIKVLVIDTTQYQALIGNDWLFKTNAPEWKTHMNNNNKGKGKQKKELTWETNNLTWTDNNESKPTSSWEWEKDKKNKRKGKEKETTQTTTTYNTYTIPQQSTYHRPKLICIDCGKKLSSIDICCGDDEEYHTNNQPCLTCGETLLDERMWNDILERERTCDICPHDDNKIWRMALAKIEGAISEEIKMIKDNPPEPLELDWDAEPIINLLDPEQFHEHYQELAPTREEQEQQLEQLNA